MRKLILLFSVLVVLCLAANSYAVLTIGSPESEKMYNSKKIPLKITVDGGKVKELLYSLDGERFTRLCRDCDGSYGFLTFKEGTNDFTVREVSYNDDKNDQTISFNIDTKKPTIAWQQPKGKYCNGAFNVRYTEAFVNSVTLYLQDGYGEDVQEQQRSDCESGMNKECPIEASLSEGDEITFWFNVSDKAGNSAVGRKQTCIIDTQPPAITDEGSYPEGRNLYLNLTLDEKATIKYIDYNEDGKPVKEKVLCSNCDQYGYLTEKKVSFSRGSHNVKIFAQDAAGNSADPSEIQEFIAYG